MKKIIMIGLLVLLFVSCGKDYETYTYMQKQKMYKEAIDNPEKMKEIEKLMELLKTEAENGDATAEKEYIDWHSIQVMTYHKRPLPTEGAGLMNLNW